ncbi:hypothetical protein NKJ88_05870 [Mesorhizobium sp. M0016]|uniref:hypothetical protein n=1 Tax=Mesorhizobium sp. M0016 TaxID=2956843 RepID=UPI003338458F
METAFVELPDPTDHVEVKHTDGTTHTAEAFKIDWNHPRLEGFRIVKKGYESREKLLSGRQLSVLSLGR